MLPPHCSSEDSYSGNLAAPIERTTPKTRHIIPATKITEYGISNSIDFLYEVNVLALF
jgi:hypothetical protein